MRRFLVSLAAFGVVAAVGASASAAELKASGQFKIKHIIMNEENGRQILPRKDMATQRVDYARANMNLQFLANQYMGFVWATELDFHFGDGAYVTNRSMGGGLAADTTNLENKQVYMNFDIPNTPLTFRGGITGVIDSYGGTFHNTDTAGLRLLADMGDTRINLDWFRWWNTNNNSIIDDVDNYQLTVSQKIPGISGLLGGSFYYLKDGTGDPKGNKGIGGAGVLNKGAGITGGGNVGATTPGNGNSVGYLTYNQATGNAALISSPYHLDSYYLGVFGNAMLGPVKLEGWGLYNFGTVDFFNAAGDDTGDADISAFMIDLMGTIKIQNISLSLEGLYVTGHEDQTNDKFGFVTANQYQLAGAFYYRHGMMVLLPDGDDIDNSSALAYDVANIWENQYLGILFLGANVSMPLPSNLSAKVGVGNLMSAEKRKVNGNTQMGTELNGSLTYTVTQGTTITLNAAYCWTGEFYDVTAADIAAFNPKVGAKPGKNEDKDDVYYTALRFMVVF